MPIAVHAGAEWQESAGRREATVGGIGWIGKKVSREDAKTRKGGNLVLAGFPNNWSYLVLDQYHIFP
jgi:hypothetical protein